MNISALQQKNAFAAKPVRSLLMTSAAAVAFAGFATPAFAQENEAEEDDSNIIIVQARKQDESLQETPVAVTAIGGDTLAKYQVNEVADVVGRIPALNVQVGGSGAGGQISLRGVGSTNISAAFDSAVAFDFDGVQVSTMRLVQAAFFDVEQIDVLKGPQSLFFGKSASAGVFSVRSANPTQDWEVGGKASYEFEEEGYTFGGYISGPLSDTFGIRVAAQYQDIDKYVELEAGTPSVFADSGKGLQNFVGRVTLQWDPVDTFRANLKVNYNHNQGDSLLGHSDIDCGPNGVADPVYFGLANAFGGSFISIDSNAVCDINDGLYPHPDGADVFGVIPAGTTGADRYTGQSYNETKTFFARLAMDVDLTDTLTLSSVSGYVDLSNEHLDVFSYVGILADGSPGGVPAPFSDGLEQFTQEFRLASDFDGMFNFMVGGFWESRTQPLATSQNAFIASVLTPDATTGNTYDWFAKRKTKSEALSFFGSVTIDITDDLELSGGARWTDEQKSHITEFPYVHDLLEGVGITVPEGFTTGAIRFSDSNVSPEVSLKYRVTDNLNVYAAYKAGFKSGGIDNSILPTAALANVTSADADLRAAALSSIVYDSETAEGGEIGLRYQTDDRAFTFNPTLFYYVFTDLQVQNFDAANTRFLTVNAGELTTKGFDVNWVWDTPVEGLSFSGAVGYTDAKFTDTFIGSDPDTVPNTGDEIDLDGRRASRAPKWSGNIAADLVVPVGDSLEIGANANLSYSGSYFTNEDTFDDYVNPSYATIDAGISVGAADGKWKLSLVGVNLTDKLWSNTTGGRPFLDAGNALGSLTGGGDDVVHTQNRGRQVFVEVAFKF